MSFKTPTELQSTIDDNVRNASAFRSVTKADVADVLQDVVDSYQIAVHTPRRDRGGERITRAAKTAVGSGVVSLVPGAVAVPLAADVAAGLALLRSSTLWGSSVAVTKTQQESSTLRPRWTH